MFRFGQSERQLSTKLDVCLPGLERLTLVGSCHFRAEDERSRTRQQSGHSTCISTTPKAGVRSATVT
jgi:hypothetical protein